MGRHATSTAHANLREQIRKGERDADESAALGRLRNTCWHAAHRFAFLITRTLHAKKRRLETQQGGNLFVDLFDFLRELKGQTFTRVLTLSSDQELANFTESKSDFLQLLYVAQAVEGLLPIVFVLVAVTELCRDKRQLLVVANCVARQARVFRKFTDKHGELLCLKFAPMTLVTPNGLNSPACAVFRAGRWNDGLGMLI
jgi:hypothetical protein